MTNNILNYLLIIIENRISRISQSEIFQIKVNRQPKTRTEQLGRICSYQRHRATRLSMFILR